MKEVELNQPSPAARTEGSLQQAGSVASVQTQSYNPEDEWDGEDDYNPEDEWDGEDDYNPEDEWDGEDETSCPDCGGDGMVEYNDAGPSVWGEDCPSEMNHMVTCPNCKGSGQLKDCSWC